MLAMWNSRLQNEALAFTDMLNKSIASSTQNSWLEFAVGVVYQCDWACFQFSFLGVVLAWETRPGVWRRAVSLIGWYQMHVSLACHHGEHHFKYGKIAVESGNQRQPTLLWQLGDLNLVRHMRQSEIKQDQLLLACSRFPALSAGCMWWADFSASVVIGQSNKWLFFCLYVIKLLYSAFLI